MIIGIWTTLAILHHEKFLISFYKNTPFILRKSLYCNDLELLTPRREALSPYTATIYDDSKFLLFFSLKVLTWFADTV